MSILSGPFSMLLAALMLSGADKLLRPAGAAQALATAALLPGPVLRRHRTSRVLARTLGLVELGVGLAAAAGLLASEADSLLAVGGAILVTLVFLGFAWFLRRVEAISPGASCGCFGSGSTSGPLHIAANLAAAALALVTALAMVLTPNAQPFRFMLGDPVTAVAFAVASIIGGLMVLLVPSLVTELRRAQVDPRPAVQVFTVSKRLRP